MDNKGFYVNKHNEARNNKLREHAERIKASLEAAEKRLKAIADHEDCPLYQSLRYIMSERRNRADKQILENYETLSEIELKLLHKERDVCSEIFDLKENLEEEIGKGYKALNKLLEKVG